MKKVISLLLILMLCLPLFACSSNQSNPQMVEEDENRIAELERLLAERDAEVNRLLEEIRKTETEATEANVTEPTETEPQYTMIELTLDNWDTYFEVVTTPVFYQNGFGEYDSFTLWYEFLLKDEYYTLVNTTETRISIEISYTWGERLCTVDFENQTYELGERVRTITTTSIADRYVDSGYAIYLSPFGIMNYDNGKVRYYEDVEMLRIQGTLCLRVE